MMPPTRTPPSCRLFGILARRAPVAVLLRRGPTEWVEVIRWDTATDEFTRGQWFHGRLYERRCDLSPDGALFVYFAAKHDTHQMRSDYTSSWTAISRPPYLSALTLWPKGDCWDGGGRFDADRVLHLNHPRDAVAHADHPVPETLRVHTSSHARGEDLPIYDDILTGKGWQGPTSTRALQAWRLVHGDTRTWLKPHPRERLVLAMELETIDVTKPGGPLHFGFSLRQADDGALVEILDAQWADWDQAGRLVYSQGGSLFCGRLEPGGLRSTRLADFTADAPARIAAPDWATRW